jgi:hypothetical protein
MTESLADRIEATEHALLAAAQAAGMAVTGDRRISEADLAALLHLSIAHLKSMRLQGEGPTVFHVGMNGCRRSYRLSDAARWIEIGRDG